MTTSNVRRMVLRVSRPGLRSPAVRGGHCARHSIAQPAGGAAGDRCTTARGPEPSEVALYDERATLTRLMSRWRVRLRGADRELEVHQDFIVGRAKECQLRLDGGLVSRFHVRLTPTSEGILVDDLESRNGVLLNDRRVECPALAHHGDVIGIGLETLEVVDELMRRRPSHLSTLPPAATPFEVSDVGGPEQETLVAQLEALSERERQVLEQIARGYTQKEIAAHLHLSAKTIESHRARIADKLACRTRADMVAYAVSAGLLRPKAPAHG